MDLCGSFQPVGPPRLSCDAYGGCVCQCHRKGDHLSRHTVHLVSVNGSLGSETTAARTRDLIMHMLLVLTFIHGSFLSVRLLGNYYRSCGELNSCEDPDPSMGLGAWLSWIPAAMLGCDPAPPWFALRREVKEYPGPHDP